MFEKYDSGTARVTSEECGQVSCCTATLSGITEGRIPALPYLYRKLQAQARLGTGFYRGYPGCQNDCKPKRTEG